MYETDSLGSEFAEQVDACNKPHQTASQSPANNRYQSIHELDINMHQLPAEVEDDSALLCVLYNFSSLCGCSS